MKVKELLANESNWCQGAYAKTESGREVNYSDVNAVSWCLVGAVAKCYPSSEMIPVLKKVQSVIEAGQLFVDWNDDPSRTFAEVKAIIGKLDI